MDDIGQTSQGLQDIDQLPVAASSNFPSYAGLAVGAVLILVLTTRLFKQVSSRRARASRKLMQMKRSIAARRTSQEDLRSLAFVTARLLAEGIRVNGVSQKTALPPALEVHQQRWASFCNTLAIARYANELNHPDQLEGLIDEARYWLRHWP